MKLALWMVVSAVVVWGSGLVWAASSESGPLDAVVAKVREEIRESQGNKTQLLVVEQSPTQVRMEVRAPRQVVEPLVAVLKEMPTEGGNVSVVVGPPESEGDLYFVAKGKKGWSVVGVRRFDEIAGHSDGGAALRDEPAYHRVAYERKGTVYLNLGAGGKERKVGSGYQPALSPDGLLLAWCYAPDGRDSDMRTVELRVASVEDLTQVRTVATGSISDPCWWPDGSRLVFWQEDQQGNGVMSEVASGGGKVRAFYRPPAGGRMFGLTVHQGSEGVRCITQDMVNVVSVGLNGKAELAPIARWTGRTSVDGVLRTQVTSSDRFVPSPADPDTWMVTSSRQGSVLFDSIVHEPISNLILHQGWLGVGKNLGLLADSVAGWDPGWSPGGGWVYFTGYRDVQAKENYPFRILRVRPNGSGLAEVARGERPSVARVPAKRLNREAAAERVLALPAYKEWAKAKQPTGHSGPRVEIVEENQREFLVRVVEHIEDDMPRRVTVGWYRVDRFTGKVKSTLP
jgi:hypothetical protein